MSVRSDRIDLNQKTRCRIEKVLSLRHGCNMTGPANLIPSQPLPGLSSAGFWRRTAATSIDAALLWCLQLGLFGLYEELASPWLETEFGSEGLLALLVYALIYSIPFVIAVLVVLPCLYYSLSESSQYQATFGKRIMRLKVVDTEGQRFSFWRSGIKSCIQTSVWLLLVYSFSSNSFPISDASSGVLKTYFALLSLHGLEFPIQSTIPLMVAYTSCFLLLITDRKQTAFDKVAGRLVVMAS